MTAETSASRPPNSIGHIDISGPDIGVLADFYATVLDWRITPRGPGYSQMATPTLGGALVEAETADLTVGVVVADLDATLAAARAAGGEVVMPATDNGWVRKARICDPAGNAMTLIQA